MKVQRTQNSENNFEKEDKVRWLTLPDFKTQYKNYTKEESLVLAHKSMECNFKFRKLTFTFLGN